MFKSITERWNHDLNYLNYFCHDLYKSFGSITRSKKAAPLTADLSSGFYVFLLALPLSLGIAEASGFPAIMGLVTASVGGLVVSWFMGAKFTIKGPAAGLIVIVLGAVNELGGKDHLLGWKLTLGAIFVAGLLQVVFGLLRWGEYVEKIPPSAIQGMLAAIGVVILSKQLYILLGIPAFDENGHHLSKPIDLIMNLWYGLHHVSYWVGGIGFVSILIVWIWSKVSHPILKAIPSPLLVMAFSIPLAHYINLDDKYLLKFSEESQFWPIPISFAGINQPAVFIKYVFLFAIIGSLESLLTVSAMDRITKGKGSDKNKDLWSIGIGNMVSSVLGGLPMISEVARSTANIHNGGRSHRANAFHGLFILVFILFSSQFNHVVPLTALAAMLVLVGVKLASPKVLIELKKIGTEQLWGFFVTLFVSLWMDLLWGLALGSLAKALAERVLAKKNDK